MACKRGHRCYSSRRGVVGVRPSYLPEKHHRHEEALSLTAGGQPASLWPGTYHCPPPPQGSRSPTIAGATPPRDSVRGKNDRLDAPRRPASGKWIRRWPPAVAHRRRYAVMIQGQPQNHLDPPPSYLRTCQPYAPTAKVPVASPSPCQPTAEATSYDRRHDLAPVPSDGSNRNKPARYPPEDPQTTLGTRDPPLHLQPILSARSQTAATPMPTSQSHQRRSRAPCGDPRCNEGFPTCHYAS